MRSSQRYKARIRRRLPLALAVAGICVAAALLYRMLSRFELPELVEAVFAIPLARLLAACAFAAASYVCLTGFDWLGLHYAGKKLRYRRVALASFTSLSLGHNIGFAALSSGTIRYRFYSRWGVGALEVAKVIGFCGVTVGLGLATLAGLALLAQPGLAGQVTGTGTAVVMGLGILCLMVPLAYLALSAAGWGHLRFGRGFVEIPALRLAMAQVLLGVLNFALVAACLHQALAAVSDVPYLAVATAYVIANVTAILSHVPGGLGVIEGTVLFLLPQANFIGAVLLFRIVYFLLPLGLGLASLSLSELILKAAPAKSFAPGR